ncbi:VOC family protein [Gordonia sp. SL306]|uniref:VOC family protein n=1 Tax=Gordonia sp. SL306 TaxID=2995145 RepID=UPI00226D4F28|nr:VOC family protein [Gordonia sp. SL306]WAC55683.1 VOC family protein [Gordonia sp. SL306]
MAVSLEMITVDTTDPVPLANWWSEQIGGSIHAENEGFFVVVSMGVGKPLLGFQKVDDPTPGKNRLHLDMSTDDLTAEVDRLIAAGATKIADRALPGLEWVTLADPDGNQFCVSGTRAAPES